MRALKSVMRWCFRTAPLWIARKIGKWVVAKPFLWVVKTLWRKLWNFPRHAVPDLLLWGFILGSVAAGLVWYHYFRK